MRVELKILRGFFLMWVRLPPRAPFSFFKIPGPSARSFSAKEGDSCGEQHEFKHASSAFSLGHFVGTNWSYRLSVFRRSTQFPEPECSSGRRPHLSRFRSQYLSRRSGSPHSAKNVFLRRLLAQPSAGREAKQLGRQACNASRARFRLSRSLSRTAEQSAEIPGAVRRERNRQRAHSHRLRKKRGLSPARHYFSGYRRRRALAAELSRLSPRLGRGARSRRLSRRILLLRNARQRGSRRYHHYRG